MAVGDESDMLNRLRTVLPNGWFPSSNAGLDLLNPITGEPLINPVTGLPLITGDTGAPDLDALLTGSATNLAFVYALIAYARLQTRIKTATDGWLDLIAYDFFGLRIQRQPSQSDASFLTTILAEIFRIRNTRAAYIKVLMDLTGQTAIIYEGWRDGSYLNQTVYLGIYGQLGSRGYPYTIFINAFRGNGVSDAQIYAAVESVRTAGITAWVLISNP